MPIDSETFQKIQAVRDMATDQLTVEDLLPLVRGLAQAVDEAVAEMTAAGVGHDDRGEIRPVSRAGAIRLAGTATRLAAATTWTPQALKEAALEPAPEPGL